MDGQKFGTNVLADDGSITFVGDSDEEARLLAACAVGERCRVVVVTGPGDVVRRLIAASKVGGPDATQSSRPTAGPSFACTKAVTAVERLICSDGALAALDRELAMTYRQAIQAAPDRRPLIAQAQRDWIASVRSRCADVACLQDAYRQRIEALRR